ncbi:MAG TPA: isoleucine--tRNA ligase [Candidatus Woesearchaeota archaeon]|nr:isoleucine--tRNA ligase [Candidatus Woesearchaeota archaeon]
MAESYNPIKIEEEILDFWEKKQTHQKLKQKNKDKEKFYFLDGPPYTSGNIHVGTAWNKSLKDCVLRYKRMKGFDVWDRAGYDMHGLPTENRVSKKLNLKDKEEIKKFGVSKFIEECKKFSLESLEKMNEDFKRLGVWMDFENAYATIQKEYISGEWWLIKKAFDKGLLYEGEKTMTWCASCETALAKHELVYKNVTDTSIFVKLKVKGTQNKFLIIWTTTPWTIPFNLGVMVHPDLDYIEAQVEDEIWIVAKGLAGGLIHMVAGKEFKELKEFKGSDLKGVEYTHPFAKYISEYQELKKLHPNVHSVVLSSKYVDLSAGSGLVHMAPGCGPEDYEVGKENNIPPYNEIDTKGEFQKSMGIFAGLVAKKDDDKFIDTLEKESALVEKTPVEHDYAHCWRCESPVVYRKTTQWFFGIENLKERMRTLNKSVNWVPQWAGTRWFDSWLENLKDNTITRQRFWGTPVPIWRCEQCDNIKVIGSYEELVKEYGQQLSDLHIPRIDEVKLTCPKCNAKMKRIPDILDVWVDAGTASWNCLDFPTRLDLFEKYFPADFIAEGKDQIRGWFNLLMVTSTVAFDKSPFLNVYMHGFVNDAQGRKMSKSLGNYISPDEIIDKYGADAFRYFSLACTNPGLDFNYNFDDLKVKYSNLSILWNLKNLLIGQATLSKINPFKISYSEVEESFSLVEKYIISRLNSTIRDVTILLDKYEVNLAVIEIEKLFLELSRTYVQLVREKLNSSDESDKKVSIYVLYHTLFETSKLFSVFAPFVCEKIYLELKEAFCLNQESIFEYNWPSYENRLINPQLETELLKVLEIVQNILSIRDKIGYGIRWPLKEAVIETEEKIYISAINNMSDIIKSQGNIKQILLTPKFEKHSIKAVADNNKLGPTFKQNSAKIIAALITTAPETVVSHIKSEGKYIMSIDGEKYEILPEHLKFEHILDKEYELSEFSKGIVFLNKTIGKELESEGVSREVSRRIQSIRKKMGLNKADRVELLIQSKTQYSLSLIDPWLEDIKEKVGAKKVLTGDNLDFSGFEFEEHEIKSREYKIGVRKI